MSTNSPGFLSFWFFFSHYFVLTILATSSVRVNVPVCVLENCTLTLESVT